MLLKYDLEDNMQKSKSKIQDLDYELQWVDKDWPACQVLIKSNFNSLSYCAKTGTMHSQINGIRDTQSQNIIALKTGGRLKLPNIQSLQIG